MVSRKKAASLLFIIFLFCAIFTPDFFPFSMRYTIIIICFIGIVWKWIRTGKAVFNSGFVNIFKGFIPFVVWLINAQLIHIAVDFSNATIYFDTLEQTLEVFIAGFFIGLFILYVCEEYLFDEYDILKMLMIVTIIQFVCVLLALIFPSVREFFNSFIIRNSYSQRLIQLAQASTSGRIDRSYGLSNNLFDSFGFITAILICIMYVAGMEWNNNKIKILSIAMILMPLVNARTGILLVIVGLIIGSAFYLDIKTLFKHIGILIISIVAFIFVLDKLPDSMVSWLTSGLLETQTLMSRSGNVGVYSQIFGSDLIFPSSILLGDGGMPKYLISYGVDNGYINCLWNFGLVGTILLLYGYFRMFKLAYKKTSLKMNKAISAVIGIVFFLYLLKVYSINNFGGIVLIYSIIAVIIARNNTYSTHLVKQ